MNIHQFSYILAVVESKNFEDAADKCSITQSTLSTMIGKFEDEIGVKVFNRKTKPVSITEEGKVVINHLRKIIHEIDILKENIQEIKGEMVGHLKIGIIPTIAPYLIPLFLTTLAERFPNVHFIVKEMTTPEIQENLKSRHIDIGILAIPVLDKELIEYDLYTEPFLVFDCSSKNRPQSVLASDLDYSKLWLMQEGHCLRTQVLKICEQLSHNPKQITNLTFESGSMDSLLRFTIANNGITIIPYLASLNLKDLDKYFINFESPIPVRTIGLITHQHFVKKKLLKEIQSLIKNVTKNIIPKSNEYQNIEPI